MDPLWYFLNRANKSLHLSYDSQYVYYSSNDIPNINVQTSLNNNIYLNTDLLKYYIETKSYVVTSKDDKLVRERAHPLSKINQYLEGDGDKKYLSKLFGFKSNSFEIIRSSDYLIESILKYMKSSEILLDVFVVAVGIMSSELDANLVLAMSTFYSYTTLLQPAYSSFRYLICFGLKEQTLKLVAFRKSLTEKLTRRYNDDPVTKFIDDEDIPEPFSSWLNDINNVYIAINTELLIHEIAAKNAFDTKTRDYYHTGVSYDIRKGVNFINGNSIDPPLIIPMGKGPDNTKIPLISLKKNLDHTDRFEIHLFDNPENFEERGLHRELDLEHDDVIPYEKGRKGFVAGEYWGQRKLFISTLDFLIQNINPNGKNLCIYIGAAPFENGKLLLDWFPKKLLNFWLIDAREINVFSSDLSSYIDDGRVVVTSGVYFDDRFAEGITKLLSSTSQKDQITIFNEYFKNDTTPQGNNIALQNLLGMINGMNKLLFISDIRSVNTGIRNQKEDEQGVDNDNRLQSKYLQEFADVAKNLVARVTASVNRTKDVRVDEVNDYFAACLKFRMPFPEYYKDHLIDGKFYNYEKGIIRIQPWARLNSTETRLWITPDDNFELINYDAEVYEQAMAYHNIKFRSATFGQHAFGDSHDSCHDCHLELSILEEYVETFGNENLSLEEQIEDKILEMDFHFKDDKGQPVTLRGHILKLEGVSRIMKRDEFNPYREIKIARYFANLTDHFTRITDFLVRKSKTKDNLVVENIINDFLLYILYTAQDISVHPTIVNALKQIFEDRLDIPVNAKDVASILEQLTEKRDEERLKLKETLDNPHQVNVKFKKDGDMITYTAEEMIPGAANTFKSNSLRVHESVLRKLLRVEEKIYDFSTDTLLHDSYFTSRAFSILRQYKNRWNKAMGFIPKSIYDLIPRQQDNLPFFDSCSTILSGNGNSILLNDELDKLFTVQEFKLFSENYVLTDQIVTVFPPNIRPLIDAYIERWLHLLQKYNTELVAVIFILPIQYNAKLIESEFYEKDLDKQFTGEVFDTITNKNAKLEEERSVIVLKTKASSFSWLS